MKGGRIMSILIGVIVFFLGYALAILFGNLGGEIELFGFLYLSAIISICTFLIFKKLDSFKRNSSS